MQLQNSQSKQTELMSFVNKSFSQNNPIDLFEGLLTALLTCSTLDLPDTDNIAVDLGSSSTA